VSVIFIITGNIMGKIKTNWFMGFRTPWALSDPDVWVKTNRMGGWVFFLAGLVTLILCFFAPEEAMVISMIGIFVVGTVLTYYMSWKWFRDKTHPPKD
ncbi:MAG: SdpI family protein, partial [Oscillospiraceae bacterium]|nr:SdpI family protein [Oscillospiraceae bacterium]